MPRRPPQLKPVPNLRPPALAYQGETPGLAPRTPFVAPEDEPIQIKIHASPSAPLTPGPVIPREESKRWRVVTWSSVVVLAIIVLLSLYNVDTRHTFLPQAHSESLAEWIGGGTSTIPVVHPTETPRAQ